MISVFGFGLRPNRADQSGFWYEARGRRGRLRDAVEKGATPQVIEIN